MDPRGALSKAGADASATTAPVHLPPEVVAEAEKVLLRSYANWTEERIPALGGKTPRRRSNRPAGWKE